MKERDQEGHKKYGTPLQAHNGRDAEPVRDIVAAIMGVENVTRPVAVEIAKELADLMWNPEEAGGAPGDWTVGRMRAEAKKRVLDRIDNELECEELLGAFDVHGGYTEVEDFLRVHSSELAQVVKEAPVEISREFGSARLSISIRYDDDDPQLWIHIHQAEVDPKEVSRRLGELDDSWWLHQPVSAMRLLGLNVVF